jgi:hypothetical protein
VEVSIQFISNQQLLIQARQYQLLKLKLNNGYDCYLEIARTDPTQPFRTGESQLLGAAKYFISLRTQQKFPVLLGKTKIFRD